MVISLPSLGSLLQYSSSPANSSVFDCGQPSAYTYDIHHTFGLTYETGTLAATAEVRMANPIELDGRTGEGGGQLVRVAVALAALTTQPIRITNVRANRGDGRRGGRSPQNPVAG